MYHADWKCAIVRERAPLRQGPWIRAAVCTQNHPEWQTLATWVRTRSTAPPLAAPRGLYRFRVTKVSDAAVEIGEVEEDLLLV